MDLRDLFTGRMSWRRLSLVLANLPVESRYVTERRNDTDAKDLPLPEPGIFGPWPQTDMLLARIGDLLERQQWAEADPKTRGAPPRPYPRPGTESNVRAISDEALAYLEYKRVHQGEDPPEDWTPAL